MRGRKKGMHEGIAAYGEDFLQFVWSGRWYEAAGFSTRDGQDIAVLAPGRWNRDAGPDFLDARLRIGAVELCGHVEIHVDARDWNAHGHQRDPAYDAVVLHVVLLGDAADVRRSDGTVVPEATLAGRLLPGLLPRYEAFRLRGEALPCRPLFGQVPEGVFEGWVDALGMARIRQKGAAAMDRLTFLKGDWEQLVWEALAAVLGGPVNKEAFVATARALPVRIARRHLRKAGQLQALLWGVSGWLLGKGRDAEEVQLKQEWEYLSVLHGLAAHLEPFRMHRMRPGARPHRRMAQLAALLEAFPVLTDLLGQDGGPAGLRKYLPAGLAGLVCINVLFPLRLQYATAHGLSGGEARIEAALRAMKAEDNRHTRYFSVLEQRPAHALASQGMLALRQQYCEAGRCLDCRVGQAVLGAPCAAGG